MSNRMLRAYLEASPEYANYQRHIRYMDRLRAHRIYRTGRMTHVPPIHYLAQVSLYSQLQYRKFAQVVWDLPYADVELRLFDYLRAQREFMSEFIRGDDEPEPDTN